jgi:addiction module RelB/DinJ family antitoxin
MNTTIHITIDAETKRKAQAMAKDLGLDLSTVVKASLKTFVQNGVFHVEKAYRMTPYLEQIIEAAEKENKTYGPFKTGEAAIKFLDAKKWK